MWERFRAWYEDARSLVCYALARARLWCLGPPRPAKRRVRIDECPVGDYDYWP